MIRRVLPALCVTLILVACGGGQSADSTETGSRIRTIDQEHLSAGRTQTDEADETTTETGADAVALPFEPPISMDPVDGSKVSIRASTPSLEYEGRIYHFSSEENLELFKASPKKYLSGSLATY